MMTLMVCTFQCRLLECIIDIVNTDDVELLVVDNNPESDHMVKR